MLLICNIGYVVVVDLNVDFVVVVVVAAVVYSFYSTTVKIQKLFVTFVLYPTCLMKSPTKLSIKL